MNACVERFNRTIQEEFIDWHKETLAYDIDEFNRKLIDWLLWYNTERPHYFLRMIPPMRYIINMKDFMAKVINDQDFLEYLIGALVDHPEDVKVDRKVDEMGVLLTLKVNPEDMGQIIGREGSTARSIRSLVRIVGLKNHARVNLKIEEPEGGRVSRAPRESAEGLDDLKL